MLGYEFLTDRSFSTRAWLDEHPNNYGQILGSFVEKYYEEPRDLSEMFKNNYYIKQPDWMKIGCDFKRHEQRVLSSMYWRLSKIAAHPEREMASLKAEMKKYEKMIPNIRIKSWLITFDHRIVRYRELRAKYEKLEEKWAEIPECHQIIKTGQANIEGISRFVDHFGYNAETCNLKYKPYVYDKAKFEKVLNDDSVDPEEKAKVKEPEAAAPEKIAIEIDPNFEETKEIKTAIEEEMEER